MHFGYLNLQNSPCIAFCATSKTSEYQGRGSTSENHTFDTDACDHSLQCIQQLTWNWCSVFLWTILRHIKHYTYYVHPVGHKRRHFNLTHIGSNQALHGKTVLKFFFNNFHPNCLHYLLDKAWSVIAFIVYSMLSIIDLMTNFYTGHLLKNAVFRSEAKWFYLRRPWRQVSWHFSIYKRLW